MGKIVDINKINQSKLLVKYAYPRKVCVFLYIGNFIYRNDYFYVFSPHLSLRDTFSQEKAKTLPASCACHLTFQERLISGNFILNENHMAWSYDLIKFRSSLFKGLQGLGQSPKVFV